MLRLFETGVVWPVSEGRAAYVLQVECASAVFAVVAGSPTVYILE